MTTIFTEYDQDGDIWTIMVSAPGMGPTPAGPRLFHIPPQMKPGAVPDWPQVKFSHPTQELAEADAGVIRRYISGLKATKTTMKYTA